MRRSLPRAVKAPVGRSIAEPADAGLSKLNSMLDLSRAALEWPQVGLGTRRRLAIQPGSVDMLGPICSDAAGPKPGGRTGPKALDRGTARCSLERR